MAHAYNRRTAIPTYVKGDEITLSMGNTYGKDDADVLSLHSFHEEHEIISVGRPLGSFERSYFQSPNPTMEAASEKQLDASTAGAVASAT